MSMSSYYESLFKEYGCPEGSDPGLVGDLKDRCPDCDWPRHMLFMGPSCANCDGKLPKKKGSATDQSNFNNNSEQLGDHIVRRLSHGKIRDNGQLGLGYEHNGHIVMAQDILIGSTDWFLPIYKNKYAESDFPLWLYMDGYPRLLVGLNLYQPSLPALTQALTDAEAWLGKHNTRSCSVTGMNLIEWAP